MAGFSPHHLDYFMQLQIGGKDSGNSLRTRTMTCESSSALWSTSDSQNLLWENHKSLF